MRHPWKRFRLYVRLFVLAVVPGLTLLLALGAVQAYAVEPTACFTYTVSGLTVNVDASCSTGDIIEYDWDWGDGTPNGNGVTASHTYATRGDYVLVLIVPGPDGADITAELVTVDLPPVASFTSTADGLTVSVDGSGSSDPAGTITYYAWDFGDGSTGSGVTASHTYATGGTYTVALTVTDDGALADSTSQAVTVVAPTPLTPTSPTSPGAAVPVATQPQLTQSLPVTGAPMPLLAGLALIGLGLGAVVWLMRSNRNSSSSSGG